VPTATTGATTATTGLTTTGLTTGGVTTGVATATTGLPTTTTGIETTTAGTTLGTTTLGTTTTGVGTGTGTTGGTTIGGGLTLRNVSNQAGAVASVVVCADENSTNLENLALNVQYSADLALSNSDISTEGSLLGSATSNFDTSSPGLATLNFIGGAGVVGPGLIARLNFHIPPGAAIGTVYPITLVSATAGGGGLTVGSGTVTVSRFKTGDINGDGTVNVRDVVMVLQASFGTFVPDLDQLTAGDVFSDGSLTVDDAIRVLRLAIGLDTEPGGGSTTAGTMTTGTSTAGTAGTAGTSTAGTSTAGTAGTAGATTGTTAGAAG